MSLVGLGLAYVGKMSRNLRKGRNIDEIRSNFGNSRKTQQRSTIDPSYKAARGVGKKDYPTYEQSVNETQPVTSPRKLYKVEQGRKALSNKPQVNEDGEAASPRDMELAKAKARAHIQMWGDNAIGRARSRLARGEQLLPHQSSAWSKHKNDQRNSRGY
jgi:hypothetical protein